MSKYENSVNRIEKQILEKFKNHDNIVIIGDNSVGKSDILLKLCKRLNSESNHYYFLDAVNRSFDASKVILHHDNSILDYQLSDFATNINIELEDVIKIRISEDRFNLQDSFGFGSRIESLYYILQEELQELCQEFMKIRFEVERKKINEIVGEKMVSKIDNQEVMLSNGYQAIIRIFLELLYFQKMKNREGSKEGIVIIDELDKYLSPSYTAKILPFIQEKFPDFTLCVTTHSRDLLKYASNYFLCPLQQDQDGEIHYEFINYRDIKDYKRIEMVFSDLFFKEDKEKTSSDDEIDTKPRQLLNLKLTESWDEEAEEELLELNSKKIAPHQKLLLKQIKEW